MCLSSCVETGLYRLRRTIPLRPALALLADGISKLTPHDNHWPENSPNVVGANLSFFTALDPVLDPDTLSTKPTCGFT
jgi:hypothetical protein